MIPKACDNVTFHLALRLKVKAGADPVPVKIGIK